MSPKKLRKIAANNKRVAAIREKCDRLSDKELIKLSDQYKQDLL
jgi:preprotein translocase subunit SecA